MGGVDIGQRHGQQRHAEQAAGQRRSGQRPLHAALADAPCGHHAFGALPLRRIGTVAGIAVVVGEVAENLQRHGGGQAQRQNQAVEAVGGFGDEAAAEYGGGG